MKIAVIGAGPSGLTTIKQLIDEGHQVTCFERSSGIGGIWYRHDGDGDEMKVFDDMKLTISIKLMSFSDYMVDDRVFVSRQEYENYLRQYAQKFNLLPHIRFGSEVVSVAKVNDGWTVRSVEEGQHTAHPFDAIAVCCGPFRKPNTNVQDIDKFAGEVIHSSRYRNNRVFRDKRVLVIGLAESGADIVRQISDVASHCTLGIQSRTFLLPRVFRGRYTTDSYTVRAHHYEMYVRATEVPFPMDSFFEDDTMSRVPFITELHKHGHQSAAATIASGVSFDSIAEQIFELGPVAATANAFADAVTTSGAMAADPAPQDGDQLNCMGQPLHPAQIDLDAEATPEVIDYINEWNVRSHQGDGCYVPSCLLCKNVTFVPNVLNGKIEVNDSGIARIDGNTVYFKDQQVSDYDVIVLCTGFQPDFSFLENIKVPDNNVRNLYKHSIHPESEGRLAFMGFVRPLSGGVPICAEMQARYFALLCSGKIQLPGDVDERIKHDKEWEENWTRVSPRDIQTIPSQIFFLDSLAREIGCLPTCEEMLDDPELLVKMWFYTFNQACYRLCGPHSLREEAIAAIKKEELPGRSVASMYAFMAASLLPPDVHPKDTLMLPTPGGGVAPF